MSSGQKHKNNSESEFRIKKTLKDIASLIDGEIIGDENIEVSNVNGIREAREGDITFLANPLYAPLLNTTSASAIITSKDISKAPRPIIRTDDPSLAFSKVISVFRNNKEDNAAPKDLHKTAIIGQDVELAANAGIGAHAVIESGSSVGSNTVIFANVYIGPNTKIGENCKIYPNVTIRENSIIGNGVIVHSGTVIGSDGFGYVNVGGVYSKIPQTGVVVIEDDVEIGSNVSIDRARFGQTRLGKGTKIDNLVQIAHNVNIGPNSIVVSQTGISGSSRLGRNTTLAGQVGVVGHVEIGDNTIVAAQSGVSKSIPPDSIVLGSPAKPIQDEKKILACLRKLPELFKAVRELKQRLMKD